jgi:GxxExxY protein
LEIDVYYDQQLVGRHRLDLIVEGKVILELKTVECLNKAHYAQVRSYLRATGLQLALLVNFAEERATFRRIESSSFKSDSVISLSINPNIPNPRVD